MIVESPRMRLDRAASVCLSDAPATRPVETATARLVETATARLSAAVAGA